MHAPHLILTVPTDLLTATSLGIDGLARHRSPGSGKHFHGRSILVDLNTVGLKPGFSFLNEGGWRNADDDTAAALAGVSHGSRTKTALSCHAFSCIPIGAYGSCHLVKTGGATLQLADPRQLAGFAAHDCHEEMTPDEIASTIGRAPAAPRMPRLYMVICPVQFLIMTTLTPEEYGWYTTHRPGKIVRQVMFTEIRAEQPHMAALSRFTEARNELLQDGNKKTKTIVFDNCLNRIPFQEWVGYRDGKTGGLYIGDRTCLSVYPFPDVIPESWHRLEG